MKAFYLVLLTFLTVTSYSQNVRLTGTLIADQEAVSVGSATVYSLPDSTLIKGTYLDSTLFSLNFKKGKETDFYAKFSVPNYLDTTINFTPTDSVVNLGLITLTKNTNLDEVNVVYRKEMFERTMDGISVNVEGTNLQNLTNLFEVLKASPKISSPDDERIEIIGRGVPLILVDRQAIISNDELKAIPASQIERIEIITNPSAKYKAQGSSNGVIEVFTKSFHLEGYNMTVRASGGMNTQLQPTAGGNIGLSLKKNKFSLNGYLGGNYNSANGFGTSLGTTSDGSNRTQYSAFDYTYGNLWQYYSIKAAYNVSEKGKIAFGVNGHGSNGYNENVSTGTYSENNEVLLSNSDYSRTKWTWLNNSAFVNYTIETDTNNSNLEFNLNYVNKISTSDALLNGNFRNAVTGDSSDFNVRNDSRDIPNIGEFRINYEHYFDTTGWKLTTGAAYSLLINGKTFDRSNYIDGNWEIAPELSNSYDYQEHIGAAFVEVSKKWKKLGFKAGVRAEYTKLDGYSNSLNQQFMDSSYIVPFPSASVLIDLSEKVALTFFYDAGIDRPQFSNYDPFIIKEDSFSIVYGNPFLRPELEHRVGFELDLFYAYNLSVTYSKDLGPISTRSFISGESFLRETTQLNADSEQTLSVSLSLPFKTDWVEGWNYVWVDYSKYTFTPVFGRDPFFNLTYGFYSYLTFNLPKDFNIMNRFRVSKWGNAENENNARMNWGLRLTKKMKANKIQIFADVDNLFPPKSKRTTYSGNYSYATNSQDEFTTFKLGIFIKFGRLRAATQIQDSSSGESDRL